MQSPKIFTQLFLNAGATPICSRPQLCHLPKEASVCLPGKFHKKKDKDFFVEKISKRKIDSGKDGFSGDLSSRPISGCFCHFSWESTATDRVQGEFDKSVSDQILQMYQYGHF